MFVPERGAILNFPPTFGMYTFLADVLVGNQSAINVVRRPDFSLDIDAALESAQRTHLVFAVSPNNPTGTLLQRDELEALLSTGLPVVVDEAYAEFSGQSYVSLVAEYPNLMVLRTLSKWAGLAGLRVGYMIADPAIVDLAMRIKQPYSVNVAAEVAALASFDDLPVLQERIDRIVRERARLEAELARVPGFAVAPSSSNFVLCHVEGIEAKAVYQALQQRGIMVRYFDNALLRNHIRITAGTPQQNDAVLEALHDITQSLLSRESARA
jgi:histidinol-phosphate aminotransferase